jgi:hypothetical protein
MLTLNGATSLNCTGNRVEVKRCDAARPAIIGISEKDKITAKTIPEYLEMLVDSWNVSSVTLYRFIMFPVH